MKLQNTQSPYVVGCSWIDIGAMTIFLYCFREREDLMDCYEAISDQECMLLITGLVGLQGFAQFMPKYKSKA